MALMLVIGPGFAVFPSSTAPPAPAAAPPSFLVVTANPEYVQAGGNATVDAYVFSGTQAADADEAPAFYMDYRGGRSGPTPIAGVQRVSMGHYRASVPIPTTRPLPFLASTDRMDVFVAANVSGVQNYGSAVVTWLCDGVWLRAFLNRTLFSPGDRLRLSVESYNGSDRADAVSVTAQITSWGGATLAQLTPNRTGLGSYEVNFTAPPFSPPAERIGVTVSAVFPGFNAVRYALVEVPRYQTWYHQTSAGGTVSFGELLVADPWGRPASGVGVNVTLDNGTLRYVNTTTDEGGRVPLNLDGGANRSVDVTAFVGRGGPWEAYFSLTRYIQGDPWVHVVPADPAVMSDGSPRDFLRPGASVTRRFRAVNFTDNNVATPISGAEVYYYAVSRAGLVNSGRTVSDADGLFAISFSVPSDDVHVRFVSSAWDWETADFQVGSPQVGMDVGPLQLGGPTLVRGHATEELDRLVEAGGLLGPWMPPEGSAAVALLNPAAGERWEQWTPNYPTPGTAMGDGVGGLSNSLYLPSFLPRDGRYAVSVGYHVGSSEKHQFAVLGVGDSTTIAIGQRFPSGTDNLLWIVLGIIAAAAAASAAAFLLLLRRRGPQRPPSV